MAYGVSEVDFFESVQNGTELLVVFSDHVPMSGKELTAF